MKTDHIKLLAPAGSFDTLRAAINAGADEVFFGITNFNMRATAAANFKNEDLPEVVKICKEHNVKTNLTVNTVMYNEDLNTMKNVIDKAVTAGVDSIIASDLATIMYAQNKNIEVHISTQVSISNIEAVKFFAKFSDRIVLARELSIEQVAEICSEIKKQNIKGPKGELVEIEVFAHGALCVAVSGRCAMSLYCYNSSANKGQCTQMCRRRYKVTDIDSGKELIVDNNYIMSSADLCTIGMLDYLVASGVTVLKFEGRGRGAEYVDTVIKTYKEALKAIQEDSYTQEKIDLWNKELGTVFNRGFTENFYMGRKVSEWSGIHGNKATKEKFQVGLVEHYYPKAEIAQVIIKTPDEIKNNEEYLIIGPVTGIVRGKLENMLLDDKNVNSAHKGDVITFKVNGKVRENDKFFVFRDRTSLIPRGRETVI
jgi:putative protease